MRPPKLIKPYVTTFCRSITAAHSPQYIQTTPTPGAPLNECFRVVADRVTCQRRSLLGWAIWNGPKCCSKPSCIAYGSARTANWPTSPGAQPVDTHPVSARSGHPPHRPSDRQPAQGPLQRSADQALHRTVRIDLSGNKQRRPCRLLRKTTEADLPPHVVRQFKERHNLTLGLIRRYGQSTTE